MLRTIRKFSSSFFAKILLLFIAVPFIFWGMGPVFQGGKQNTIAEIGNEKISTQEFVDYIRYNAPNPDFETLDKNLIEKLLSNFIGEKLIALEIENHDIKLSENSLSKIIKNEKAFKKNNKFSRTEYEKYLVKNSLNAVVYEANLSKLVKKEQLFDFIGKGIMPSKFLVNIAYDKINQKRNIEVINLNDVFEKKSSFNENQIESYFNQNKDTYKIIYKSIQFIKLNPKNLTGDDEFTDLFFQKIDEIDDLIFEGKNLDFLLNRFNLASATSATFNELDQDRKFETDTHFPNELIKKTFDIDQVEPTVLIEHDNNYFIVELTKTENIQRKVTDQSVKKEILLNLKKQTKRKLISEIISKINKNNFKKNDFDKLSKDEKVVIKKIRLENRNDDNVLKQELINQIYAFSEKKVIVVADIEFSENFLIYIDKIENVSIGEKTENYKKYFDLSKNKITTDLYNTYNSYLENKYEININYQTLAKTKNYF